MPPTLPTTGKGDGVATRGAHGEVFVGHRISQPRHEVGHSTTFVYDVLPVMVGTLVFVFAPLVIQMGPVGHVGYVGYHGQYG